MAENTRELQQRWYSLLEQARWAGMNAGAGNKPTPMVVGTPRNTAASLLGLDDGGLDPKQPIYHVAEGVCGFAWVALRGTGTEGRKFINWLTGRTKPATPALDPTRLLAGFGRAGKRYEGGHHIWVHAFGQSMQRKEAAAQAAAEVLRGGIEGLTAYAGSRMD